MAKRQRDYKAEYAARKQRAAAKGLTGQAAYGHKKRAAKAETRRAERVTPTKRPLTAKQQKAAEKRRKTKHLGPARIVKTSSARKIIAELRAAAARGDRVAVYIVMQFGSDYRTRVIDGKKRKSPKPRLRLRHEKPKGDVQLVFAPKGHLTWTRESPGLDPQELLDEIAGAHDDGDTWDEATWAVLNEYAEQAYE